MEAETQEAESKRLALVSKTFLILEAIKRKKKTRNKVGGEAEG
jgi:hypothetical protein